MEKVVPEVVNQDDSSEHLLSVNYGNLVSLLIESIKELNNDVKTLQNENASLKSEVETLKSQMQIVLSSML